MGRPRFYGGSLLKVRVTRTRCPGTFSQSMGRDTIAALCACASLRFFERGNVEGPKVADRPKKFILGTRRRSSFSGARQR